MVVRLRRSIGALLTLASVLQGCADTGGADAKLEEYLQRLERAVGGELAAAPLLAPPRLVDAQLTALEVPSSAIGMIDFLSLSGCELQVNLGRRNSSLGRNASPSQQLLLDLEFLRLAPDCAEHLQSTDNPDLAQAIMDAARQREAALPALIYNALFTGPEYRDFWRLPARLGNYPENTSGEVIDALGAIEALIARWLNGDFRADSDVLEGALAVMRSGDGGALLLASAQAGRQLARGTQLFQARAATRALCPGQRETEAAKIAKNVVSRFFAMEVQAWLAQVTQRRWQLLEPLIKIESRLEGALPPEYQQWREARADHLDHLTRSPRAHVDAIKNAFEGCPDLLWQES